MTFIILSKFCVLTFLLWSEYIKLWIGMLNIYQETLLGLLFSDYACFKHMLRWIKSSMVTHIFHLQRFYELIIHYILYLHIHGLLVLNLYSNCVGFALECFGCLALLSKENHGWKWNNASKFLFNTIVLYVEPLLYHLHVHFFSILKSLTPFCTLLNFVCIIRCRHHGEDYCNTQRGCKK